MSLLAGLRYYPVSVAYRLQVAAARRLLAGPYKWRALDRLGVHGHGADLIRLDFPPATDIRPRWGYGRSPHPQLSELFGTSLGDQLLLLEKCLSGASAYLAWPKHQDPLQPALPWRENEFIPPFDAVALYGMLEHLRPERYVEIGSGISTRIAWQARKTGVFPMEIVSIDPEPRLDVGGLCDRVHRNRLEEMPPDEFLGLVSPRSVVFVDGSHRSFPGSDVTIFFLDILPRLPRGTIVHLHDIYLPCDYPARALDRYWSEQYVLAAYLLGGARRIEVLLAGAFLAMEPQALAMLTAALGPLDFGGTSFWFQVN